MSINRQYNINGLEFDESDLFSAVIELLPDYFGKDATKDLNEIWDISKRLFPMEYGEAVNDAARGGWEPENLDPAVEELLNEDLFCALCDYSLHPEAAFYFFDKLDYSQGSMLIFEIERYTGED